MKFFVLVLLTIILTSCGNSSAIEEAQEAREKATQIREIETETTQGRVIVRESETAKETVAESKYETYEYETETEKPATKSVVPETTKALETTKAPERETVPQETISEEIIKKTDMSNFGYAVNGDYTWKAAGASSKTNMNIW